MVGDGVNDAAAMARATVGVAVRGGAEASLAAADVFLARPGLTALVDAGRRRRATLRSSAANIAVSIVYNLVGAALADGRLINPLMAAILMPASSLTVVLASWRGRTFEGPGRRERPLYRPAGGAGAAGSGPSPPTCGRRAAASSTTSRRRRSGRCTTTTPRHNLPPRHSEAALSDAHCFTSRARGHDGVDQRRGIEPHRVGARQPGLPGRLATAAGGLIVKVVGVERDADHPGGVHRRADVSYSRTYSVSGGIVSHAAGDSRRCTRGSPGGRGSSRRGRSRAAGPSVTPE